MPNYRFRPTRFLAAAAALALTLTGIAAPPEALADGPTSFANTSAINVPALGSANQIGPASPYPSTVAVSGMAGTVSEIQVTLHNATAGVLNDFDVLLVGPTGANLILMSDLGDNPAAPTLVFANNVNLTIADGGGAFPNLSVPSGTYRPTNVAAITGDSFPGPAPTPSSVTSLAEAFNGTDPNGVWSLYVVDDNTGDIGSIAGGWSLSVTTAVAALPGQLAFSAAQYRGVESAGVIPLTVNRTGGSDGEVSVNYATSNGTAVAGTDYTASSGTLTFADGQTSATISVPVIDDDLALAEVGFNVTLSSPAGGATLGSPTTASVVIENDDGTANPAAITINAGGPASPYPSNLHIQGLGNHLIDVDVHLSGFQHTFAPDVDMLLVGPSGQSVILMSDTGGTNTAGSTYNLTFDDQAGSQLGDLTQSGSYRPTNVGGGDAFPAPAPSGPYGSALSVFSGTDPHGTWRLFIFDDATGDAGAVTGGWSLRLTTGTVDAGGPYSIAEGDPVTLTGSTNVSSSIYAWDLDGDGLYDDASGSNPSVPAATLAALGLGDGPIINAPVGLRVTSGSTVLTTSTTLTVTNVAPVGVVSNSGPVLVGESATVTLSGLSDASAVDVAAGLVWSVDVDGDGVADASGSWRAGDPDPVVTVPASVLSGVGSFDVDATVSDKDGGSVSLSTGVVVQATTPTASLSGDAVDEGEVAAVTFSDPVDAAPGAVWSYSFDFDGDGVFDVVDSATPSADLPAGLTADGPATVSVTGRIANQYGGFSDYTADVTVTNVAPMVGLGVPTDALVGDEVNLVVSLADPSADDEQAGFDLTVDFGDGTVIDTAAAPAGDTTFTHSYAEPGTYEVQVVAVDADGGRTAETRSIEVAAKPTPTPTPSPSVTPTPTPTPSASPTPSATPKPSATPTATTRPTVKPTPTWRPTSPVRPGLPSSGV